MKSREVLIIGPWNQTSYEDALEKQCTLTREGRYGWILFCCPPTITLGKRGHFSDVLMPMAELRRLNVRLLPVDRGGQVTYHGPGQVIGFPVGTLEMHTGDSRGVRRFVSQLQERLSSFLVAEGCQVEAPEDCAGIYLRDAHGRRKVVAMGMSFGREGIRHGFAMNLIPMIEQFELVNPCGEIGARPASVFQGPKSPAEIGEAVERLRGHLML